MTKKVKHVHSVECQHFPTAVPAGGNCPVCLKVPPSWSYCRPHNQWECGSHIEFGIHHGEPK